MTAVGGLVFALVCLAIVGAGLGLAVAAWRPGPPASLLLTAGAAVGGFTFLLAALHWLAHLLT
ncbi:hypothetical protein ACIRF8_12805 [Streptomyces sp. NPDC102406]|uniref:hypothetical protein n=1 Tax=Streptomyces sp. NPDC102406 TaxID=3366171 RepID=UPI00382B1F0A